MQSNPQKKEFINIITLGCSKNLVDTEYLLKQLEANNLGVMHNRNSFRAKTVIINTCGFIRDAKQESIDTILRFIKARESGKISRVLVMGCLAERYKSVLATEIPEVDKYFGTNDLKSIIQYLGLNYKKNLLHERFLTTPGHYAYLKLSEGCDRSCSFCAIPLMRGRHRSRPIEEIVIEAGILAAKGVKELILVAQDLTMYGTDLYKKQLLPELLKRLSGIKGIEWIRMHYAYPAGFPYGILQVMKERYNICNYLDIPFQHNSDKVLKMMRRGHTKTQNLKLIDRIRKQIPDIALRTTLIAGHPGEGDREFEELAAFVRSVRFDRLGVFSYSEEEDTYAAGHFKDEVPDRIKESRVSALMEMQQDISKELNDNKIGKLFKVLIDRREGEYYVGRTESDSPEVDHEILISVGSARLNKGRFYKVLVTGSESFDLYGKVVTSSQPGNHDSASSILSIGVAFDDASSR
jgi:ribosomal protein S12 methylthiotransferase